MRKISLVLMVAILITSVFNVASFAATTTLVKANEDNINVRTGPGTTYTVIGEADRGNTFTYLGSAKDSANRTWYKIQFSATKVGYIISTYTSLITQTTTPPTYAGKLTVTASPTLNVRSAPSTTAAILGKLNYGTLVDYYTLASGWYKIDYNGKVAYISATYAKVLSTTPPPPEPTPSLVGKVVTTADPTLNVRAAASTTSTILGKLNLGTTVGYYSLASGWYKIDYNGKVAYISATYAKVVSTTPPPPPEPTPSLVGKVVTTADPTLNVRAAASTTSTILGKLNLGTTVGYYSLANGWYKIDYNGKVGYISASYAKVVTTNPPPPPEPVNTIPLGVLLVNADPAMNVRAAATTGSSILGTVKFGTLVPYYETLSGWYRILYNGKTGYLSATYAKPVAKGASLKLASSLSTFVVGAPVSLNASANGFLIPQFKYSVLEGTTWTVLGDFTTAKSLQYTPKSAGLKKFKLEVRESGSSSVTAQYNVDVTFNWGEVSAVTLTTTPEGTSFIKQPLRLAAKASATGQTLYQFSVIKDGVESIVRPYAVTQQFDWKPLTAGVFTTKVSIKDSLNPSGKVLTDTEPITIVIPKVTALNIESKTYYQNRQNTVRVSSVGSPTPVYDISVVSPTGVTTKLTSGFVTATEVKWTPTEVGAYKLRVSVKDENNSVTDISKEVTASVVVPKATGAKLGLYPIQTSYKLTEPITFQATASGSPDLLYRFTVKNTTSGELVHTQPFAERDYMLWATVTAGNYNVKVDIKDALASAEYETTANMNFSIANVQGSAHYYTVNFIGKTLEQAAAEQDTVVGTQARSMVQDSTGKWVRATADQIKAEIDPTRVMQFDYTKPSSSNLGSLEVKINGLNVRSLASTSGSVLGTVNNGEIFQVYSISNGWYQIHYDGKLGWVVGDYVSYREQAPVYYAVGTLIQVNTDDLNIRSAASVSGTILGTAQAGENYVVLEDSGTGWYKIKRDTITGWISGYYVTNNIKTDTYTDLTRAIPQQMFQFLDLRNYTGLTVADLNKMLVGKGILENQGQAFVEASIANNVNEVYLVAHANLETGNGKSSLANGYFYNPTTDTILPYGSEAQEGYVKVYNMFGIGAIDSNPVGGGVRTAYKNGWTTPALAIKGGAAWIGTSYVNNTSYNQFTLYKMRWNPDNIAHQYATDIGWARKQTSSMASMYSMVNNYSFRFIIPQYQ